MVKWHRHERRVRCRPVFCYEPGWSVRQYNIFHPGHAVAPTACALIATSAPVLCYLSHCVSSSQLVTAPLFMLVFLWVQRNEPPAAAVDVSLQSAVSSPSFDGSAAGEKSSHLRVRLLPAEGSAFGGMRARITLHDNTGLAALCVRVSLTFPPLPQKTLRSRRRLRFRLPAARAQCCSRTCNAAPTAQHALLPRPAFLRAAGATPLPLHLPLPPSVFAPQLAAVYMFEYIIQVTDGVEVHAYDA